MAPRQSTGRLDSPRLPGPIPPESGNQPSLERMKGTKQSHLRGDRDGRASAK